MSDLKNYKKDGGVIFFVIYLESDIKYKIYYKILLPLDLKEILEQVSMRKNTKKTIKNPTKTLVFEEFPSEPNEVMRICLNFLNDQKKQISTIDFSPKVKNIFQNKDGQFKKFSFSTVLVNENFVSSLFGNPVYLYGISQDIGIEIPLTKLNIVGLSSSFEKKFIWVIFSIIIKLK